MTKFKSYLEKYWHRLTTDYLLWRVSPFSCSFVRNPIAKLNKNLKPCEFNLILPVLYCIVLCCVCLLHFLQYVLLVFGMFTFCLSVSQSDEKWEICSHHYQFTSNNSHNNLPNHAEQNHGPPFQEFS